MPTVSVVEYERFPDYRLQIEPNEQPGMVKYVAPSGGWSIVAHVALTDAEWADWQRVRRELHEWEVKIGERLALLPQGPRTVNL